MHCTVHEEESCCGQQAENPGQEEHGEVVNRTQQLHGHGHDGGKKVDATGQSLQLVFLCMWEPPPLCLSCRRGGGGGEGGGGIVCVCVCLYVCIEIFTCI